MKTLYIDDQSPPGSWEEALKWQSEIKKGSAKVNCAEHDVAQRYDGMRDNGFKSESRISPFQ